MKLSDWLAQRNPDGSKKRRYEFARLIGVTPTMVTLYAAGRTWPDRDTVEAIVRATNGAVQANDFLSEEARRICDGASA
jgi:DNA-binding transcriptional regulator YdaS (Cro superfamily)